MRTISVSTGVYAKIWSLRDEGEETEDSILRRVLSVTAPADDHEPSTETPEGRGGIGYKDSRSGVQFSEGFEIFRTYKGTEYRAVATRGEWLLTNTNERFSSLHKLSSSIFGTVNAWTSWYYLDEQGQRYYVDRLRQGTAS